MFFRKRNRVNKKQTNDQKGANQSIPLSSDVNQNIEVLRSIYKDCSDVVYRPFFIGGNTRAVLIYN